MRIAGSFLFIFFFFFQHVFAQGDLYFQGAIKSRRDAAHRNIVRNIINKNLSLPVSDSTAEQWISALNAIQVLNYKSPWVNNRISEALQSNLSDLSFKKALFETINGLYPSFPGQVKSLFQKENEPMLFALMAEYLLLNDPQSRQEILKAATLQLSKHPGNSYLNYLIQRHTNKNEPLLSEIFSPDFLHGEVLMISILRKDRSYPGIVIVRDTSGKFIKDSNGIIFNVSQLGRSVTNLPYYFKGGNTPQGLFRMNGYGISQSEFIGPTPNIQMLMPNETTGKVFFKNTLAGDTISREDYGMLLPPALRSNDQFYESWNAGQLGRNEIIAHGTTVNPDYYKSESFFPLTPTQGCLSTIEIWDTSNGRRERSDQARLISAIAKAGGPNGYVFVFEIDDTKQPLLIGDLMHLIP